MKRIILAILFVAGIAGVAISQTTPIYVVGTEQVGFTQVGPDLTTVQTYRIRVCVDGTCPTTGRTPTCTGSASPFSCQVPMGTMSVGPHNLTLTAAAMLDATTETAQSGPSAAIAVQMLANAGVPNSPTLPRIIRIP